MIDQEREQAIELIAIALMARDECITFSEAKIIWDNWKLKALDGHRGDCTKEPNSCAVCTVERYRKEVCALLARNRPCEKCKGTGDDMQDTNHYEPGSSPPPCSDCKGTGKGMKVLVMAAKDQTLPSAFDKSGVDAQQDMIEGDGKYKWVKVVEE